MATPKTPAPERAYQMAAYQMAASQMKAAQTAPGPKGQLTP